MSWGSYASGSSTWGANADPPVVQTATTLCTEGLKKAGYKSTSAGWATLLTRAEDIWLEEIKYDIYSMERKLKSLMNVQSMVTTNGYSTYTMPADFGSALEMAFMDGSHYGLAQDGAAGSITLDASEDVGTQIIGKMIFIYAGAGVNQSRQCTAFDDSTKIATVAPDWTTTPGGTSYYLLVDVFTKLLQYPVWEYDGAIDQTHQGPPSCWSQLGDEDYGQFILYPAPYRTTEVPWGIRLRYYANLQRLDNSSPVLTTVYRNWRNLWVQGILIRALQDLDDNRTVQETTNYWNMMRQMVGREKYGSDITELQHRVEDYD